MPGVFMSTSRELMPRCLGALASVRTSRYIPSPHSAPPLHPSSPFTSPPTPRPHSPPVPVAPPLERLPIRRHSLGGRVLDAQGGGEVGGEPAADLRAELLLLGRVGEIHAPLLAPVPPRLKACYDAR